MTLLTMIFEWAFGLMLVALLLYCVIATALDIFYQRCEGPEGIDSESAMRNESEDDE